MEVLVFQVDERSCSKGRSASHLTDYNNSPNIPTLLEEGPRSGSTVEAQIV